MKLDEIITLWDTDCQIDRSELISESLKIPQVHNKYYKFLLAESKILRDVQEEFKIYAYKRWMYYQGRMDKEELDKLKWEQCDISYVKTDIQKVLDADAKYSQYIQIIGAQTEKVEYLREIIKTINNRSFLLGHAIEMTKLELGLN